MRRAAAAFVALLLGAGLTGPALPHLHGGDGAPALAALDTGSALDGAQAGETCTLCAARAPVRHLSAAGTAACTAAPQATGRHAQASLLRAPRSPLRDSGPARAPPRRA